MNNIGLGCVLGIVMIFIGALPLFRPYKFVDSFQQTTQGSQILKTIILIACMLSMVVGVIIFGAGTSFFEERINQQRKQYIDELDFKAIDKNGKEYKATVCGYFQGKELCEVVLEDNTVTWLLVEKFEDLENEETQEK